MLPERYNGYENPNTEIRNNIENQMFKIQNKTGPMLSLSVLIIDIFVI